MQGTIIPVPWHFAASKNQNFTASARSLWGINVNWRAAMSYDAVEVLRVGRSIGQITPKKRPTGTGYLSTDFDGL
ncbi:MAG: hypothetical protein HC894_11565 [Microcoleus sp. SM1_3_4]|nr:hypothetical protein [Microcoleus sp. SM1_3_4]